VLGGALGSDCQETLANESSWSIVCPQDRGDWLCGVVGRRFRKDLEIGNGGMGWIGQMRCFGECCEAL